MGTDKSLLPFRGKTLIGTVAEAVRPFAAEVLVSTNEREAYGFLEEVRFVEDFCKGEGPLAGLVSALEAAETPWVFFTTCDLPLLNGEFVDFLAEGREEGVLAVVPSRGGFLEPLISLIHQDALSVARRYFDHGGRRAGGFLEELAASGRVMVLETEGRFDGSMFLNVNRPEEYALLKGIADDQ